MQSRHIQKQMNEQTDAKAGRQAGRQADRQAGTCSRVGFVYAGESDDDNSSSRMALRALC